MKQIEENGSYIIWDPQDGAAGFMIVGECDQAFKEYFYRHREVEKSPPTKEELLMKWVEALIDVKIEEAFGRDRSLEDVRESELRRQLRVSMGLSEYEDTP